MNPPTVEEAAFAAQGLTSNIDAQVEIVAELMGLPREEVDAVVRALAAQPDRAGRAVVHSARRPVIVERRVARTARYGER